MKVEWTEQAKEDMKRLFSDEWKYKLLRGWRYVSEDFWRELKWKWQRAQRGYSDSDRWDLDSYLSGWLPQALREMKNGMSYPGWGEASTSKKWAKILEDMAKGFDAHRILSEEMIDQTTARGKKLVAQKEKGMKLFVEWFNNLWD